MKKSTMVFGGSAADLGQLKFFATGSANYTVGAMINLIRILNYL